MINTKIERSGSRSKNVRTRSKPTFKRANQNDPVALVQTNPTGPAVKITVNNHAVC
jgi:hypothetical protein